MNNAHQCCYTSLATLEQQGTTKHLNDSIRMHTCIKLRT